MRHPAVRLVLLAFAVLVPFLLLGAFAVPVVAAWASGALSPGLGVKDAALIALGVAFGMIVLMGLAAGDGIVGELGVMVPGLLVFFLICWLMLAWVF